MLSLSCCVYHVKIIMELGCNSCLFNYINSCFFQTCIGVCNIHINSFSSGTVWLRQVTCGDTYNCLSYCAGGSCPTSSVTCTDDVAHVTCSE